MAASLLHFPSMELLISIGNNSISPGKTTLAEKMRGKERSIPHEHCQIVILYFLQYLKCFNKDYADILVEMQITEGRNI